MTVRCRPNRLGYLLAGLTSFMFIFYLCSSQYHLFSENQLEQWDSLGSLEDGSTDIEIEPDLPLVLEDGGGQAELTEQGLRITLSQLYENARVDLLGYDEELGEHEEETHEDYIYRLAKFVGDHFVGSPAQLYLRKMLTNLNLHIAPPLLRSAVRRGIVQITNTKTVGVKGDERYGHGLRRKRAAVQPQTMWEPNVWAAPELARAYAALSRGRKIVDTLWGSLTGFEERKVVIKYTSLLLWGGAYAEDSRRVTTLAPLGLLADAATDVLPAELGGPRSSLQPLTPLPPSPPRYIPPSLDPNWTRLTQSDAEKEVALILTQAADPEDGVNPELILAKALHPVHLDILEILSRRVDQERVHAESEGKRFDSGNVDFADGPLLNDAVDRYLRVQYGSSLRDLIRLAGDEAVRMGDILLLPSPE